MEETEFENLKTPFIEAPAHQRELKMTLLGAKRTAAIGVWLIVTPAFLIFCIFMKYYFGVNMHLFDVVVEMFLDLGRDPFMEWFSPILLLLPLVGVVLNALAITHFGLDSRRKELLITIKLRWWNILLIVVSAAIVGLFVGYVFIENIHHKG